MLLFYKIAKDNMSMPELGFSSTIKESWEIFKKKWAIIYGLFSASFMFSALISAVSVLLEDSAFLYFIFNVVMWIASMVLSMGLVKALIYLSRGKEVNLDLIFSTYHDLWKYIWGSIRVALVICLGYFLLIVPGIIWTIKYMFTLLLIVDKGVKAKEAMDMSAKMTEGIKWKLFVLYLLIALFSLSGMFALGIGLLITAPVASLTYYLIYNKLLARLEKAE